MAIRKLTRASGYWIGLLVLSLAITCQIPSKPNTAKNLATVDATSTKAMATLRPEAYCDLFFSIRHSLPPGSLKDNYELRYQGCIKSRETPIALKKTPKPLPTPVRKPIKVAVAEKGAGNGKIFENPGWGYDSYHEGTNIWEGTIHGEKVRITAGAITMDENGAILPDNRKRGLIEILTIEPTNNMYGNFFTPIEVGKVRIVDVQGTNMILASQGKDYFIFNLEILKYTKVEQGKAWSRVAGVGELFETSEVPYPIEGYHFENYWVKQEGNSQITVEAGISVSTRMGLVAVIVADVNNSSEILEQTIYRNDVGGISYRITDVSGQDLIICGGSGNILIFNAATSASLRRYISSSARISTPQTTAIPLITPVK